jgi:starch synthase
MLLIPSRYEPCGLTQMIAMRYGTVPIGRATGGLLDTIIDYDQTSGGTGFIFEAAEHQSLEGAMRRAIRTYGDQRRWRGLQRRGMRQNFSWGESARNYLKLYFQLMDKKSR